MKILKGTDAWIEGKKYKEGSSIPQKYEKEFEKYLVDVPDLPNNKAGASPSKEKNDTPSKNKK